MKVKRKISFLPKTKWGKISVWLALIGVFTFYIQYWTMMWADNNYNMTYVPQGIDLIVRIIPGFIAILLITTNFATSLRAIIKDKDYSIILFISALIGTLGVLFLLGEFIFPH